MFIFTDCCLIPMTTNVILLNISCSFKNRKVSHCGGCHNVEVGNNRLLVYVWNFLHVQHNLEKLYAERQRVQNILEEKLSAIECESGNAEVQC